MKKLTPEDQQDLSMQYDDTNQGAMFKKKTKKTDTSPDYGGEINVNGTEFWLSGWTKTSKAGEKYMSLSVRIKEDQPKNAPATTDGKDPF